MASLTALAVAAIGVELDRASVRYPFVVDFVPRSFRSFSLSILTDRALASGNVTTSLAGARALIISHPVPAEGLSKLGVAALQAGDEGLAARALGIAAQRGWRDVIAQQVTAASAIESGEWSVAADRISALWQTRQSGALIDDLTRKLVVNNQGRALFLNRISKFPQVSGDFIVWSSSNLDAKNIKVSIGFLRSTNLKINCGDIAVLSTGLADSGHVNEADALWSGACRQGQPTLSSDLLFAVDDTQVRGPFDWFYPSAGGLDRAFSELPHGGFTLAYNNANPIRKPLATIITKLSSGHHTVRILPASGVKAPELHLVAICLQASGGSVSRISMELDSHSTSFTLPATDCSAQRLLLMAPAGAGKLNGIMLE